MVCVLTVNKRLCTLSRLGEAEKYTKFMFERLLRALAFARSVSQLVTFRMGKRRLVKATPQLLPRRFNSEKVH